MTEQELLKEAYGRTVYAGLKVVSLSLNLMKHASRQKDKQKIGMVEAAIDQMLNRIKSTFSGSKKQGFEEVEKQFDSIVDFTFELQSMASIIPTDKVLYDRILERFGEMCKEEIENYSLLNQKQ